MPSEAVLPAFFVALARPFCLRIVWAFSKSPLHSVSAFLHSIMPTPVFSLSSLTMSAEIVVMPTPPRSHLKVLPEFPLLPLPAEPFLGSWFFLPLRQRLWLLRPCPRLQSPPFLMQ